MTKLLAFLSVLTLLPIPCHRSLTLPNVAVRLQAPQLKFSKSWTGMSSWYGDAWKGRKTACGQKFDPELMTVAHPYLKCGTTVRVTNVRTGQSAFARVTDRGPYQDGREMDVSEAVAKHIGIKKYGVEKVKIEVVL